MMPSSRTLSGVHGSSPHFSRNGRKLSTFTCDIA